jgi:glycosyltransferase involved in cell wall biosynthesis
MNTRAELEPGLVTVVVTTYNRAGMVPRAIRSVLAQTYARIDCLVVDDGSTDDTSRVLKEIADPRVRVVRHEKNRGATSAKNTGLDHLRGEWFTFVDSDDEIVPEAIETLVGVALANPGITQVECNCVDAGSGRFTGSEVSPGGPIEAAAIANTHGDHWGIIGSSLVGSDRFNERLPGYEEVLWFKVRERARIYYLDRGLKIVHRGGGDRLSQSEWTRAQAAAVYRELVNEPHWLRLHAAYRPADYPGFCLQGLLHTLAAGDRESARAYDALIGRLDSPGKVRIAASAVKLSGPAGARAALGALRLLKSLKRSRH